MKLQILLLLSLFTTPVMAQNKSQDMSSFLESLRGGFTIDLNKHWFFDNTGDAQKIDGPEAEFSFSKASNGTWRIIEEITGKDTHATALMYLKLENDLLFECVSLTRCAQVTVLSASPSTLTYVRIKGISVYTVSFSLPKKDHLIYTINFTSEDSKSHFYYLEGHRSQ